MRNTFTLKLILTFLLFGITLLLLTFFIIFKLDQERLNESIKRDAEFVYNLKKSLFDTYIEEMESKLVAVVNSKIFIDYINSESSDKKAIVQELFLNISQSSNVLMQLRYIDSDGMETIRVDKSTYNDKPYLVVKDKLQNKKDRYYFKESYKIRAGEVWYSKIDLNMEYKEIERPLKPVLRVATPVVQNGVKHGIVIINIFMEEILNKIVTNSVFDICVVDKDEYVLVSSISQLNWNRYIKNDSVFYREMFDSINAVEKFDLNFNNNEGLKLFVHYKGITLNELASSHITELLIALIGVLIISIPLSIIFSRYPSKIQNKLSKLNSKLEEKIQEAVQKHQAEEKIFLQQSKLATLGEMLSMISHQWRQPLASINTVVANIKIKSELDQLEKKELNNYLDNIETYVLHLSSIINTFKNFYKPQTEKKELYVNDLINNALVIVGDTISNSEIVLEKSFESKVKVYIYENELVNSILNILINAQEALLDSDIEDKHIFIKTYDSGKNTIIEISDNAGGIQAEVLEKIFDPYFSTKEKKNGTGLGLYMSKLTVEKHCQGKLEVKNLEDGVEFKIILENIN